MSLSERFKEHMEEDKEPMVSQPFSEAELTSLPQSLPKDLIGFFETYGRCQMKQGILQTCHPNDFRSILALIFGADADFSHKNCNAFAYSAFGEIYFWHEGYGVGYLKLYDGRVFSRNLVKGIAEGAKIELGIYSPFYGDFDEYDYLDLQGKALFKKAVKKCGMPEIGECFGFVPVLALGGIPDITCIKRLSAPEHFAIACQTIEYNLIHVRDYGDSVIVRPIG